MKTFEHNITRIPEGRERGTNLETPKTQVQVAHILDTQELKMTSRNLDYAEVQTTLIMKLHDYLEKSGQESYVMGVSGGIDSALVSTLCAMTGKKLIVVEMPIHQTSDEVDRAQDHITWLQKTFPNVINYRVDLTETFETIKRALPEISDEITRYMALVNTRSRLRGVTLYALAGEYKGLVAGTGNRVEDYGIGFFTKYGDGAVDISPIGELYKSEVYTLAGKLGVIDSILQAKPTDGLHSNGASDEDQIGATYDELEWAMGEYDLGKRASNFGGRAQEVMNIYTARHEVNAHKMSMPPVFSIS